MSLSLICISHCLSASIFFLTALLLPAASVCDFPNKIILMEWNLFSCDILPKSFAAPILVSYFGFLHLLWTEYLQPGNCLVGKWGGGLFISFECSKVDENFGFFSMFAL